MADFSDFELGANVYELAGGLVPEMAKVFQVDLGDTPNAVALGALVGAIGAKKTLRENEKGAQAWLTQVTGSDGGALELAKGWLGRSGVQEPLNRSLWTPELSTPDGTPIVVTGGVANWQDRTAELIIRKFILKPPQQVFLASGTQVMDSVTEVINPNVVSWRTSHKGVFPTQGQYAEDIIKPRLEAAGHEVNLSPYDTQNGDEIAARFVADHPELFREPIAAARVANAGVQLLVQLRKVAKSHNPSFDADRNNPQAFVLTDDFPIARTLEQAKPQNAKDYQSPFTGIRQVALTAKLLLEAVG